LCGADQRELNLSHKSELRTAPTQMSAMQRMVTIPGSKERLSRQQRQARGY